ncbi:MAG: VWA domain-containing protein [Methanoculleus marisnigri]|nr:VWA domain-containing protein [Methanoculleus marisnigri]
MNGWTYVCLVVGLLFLAAPASALIPDDITLSTDKPWLVAGNGETATVTILVTNGTSADPVSGVDIDLAVDGEYGSISPARVTTGSDGEATATFRHGTLSGTATITATVSEGVDVPLTGSVDQQIDHAAAHKIANLWYEPKVTAGETTEIVVRMVDEYGNLVDSRNVAETVFFMVGSPACFVNGTDEITVPVDAAGNVTATLRVDTTAGGNVVLIQPPSPLVLKSFTITGEGGLPAAITQEITPSSGSVPADGKTKVSFTYTLLDEYGNPSGEQGLWVNATLKRLSQPDEYESRLLNTNSYGQVMITYGPEDSVGMAIITATAAVNESVSISEDVEFTSTDPTNMLLSASPQSMPSRDVKDDSVSRIRAKVMDVRGNPVEGQTVEFQIVLGSIDIGNFTPTASPELDTASAITNDNGYALVEFSPGSFAREGEPGWSDTATGKATVRATWGNVSRDIELTWKNYPYLSVETEVSPETVAVNDTVDVTIRLKGDGWALQPDPIDVVLVIDRSGSMTGADVSPTRMAAAKAAANDFVDQMDAGRDRVALVSFAFDATLDQGLTDDPDEIKGAINSLSADGATNMRMAYYTAIKYLKENGRPDAVKAVILMGDGDWNYHGSPLAKGTGYADNNRYLTSDWYSYPYWAPLSGYRWSGSSYSFSNERYEWYHDLPDPKGDASGTQKLDTGYWYDTWNYNKKEYRTPTNNICDNGQFTNQNMSVYANSGDETGNVTIYSIGFASVLGSDVERDLGVLSEATGGKYVWAGNEAELRNVYTEIAGELKTEAGVDTKLKVVFDNVEVNENLTSGADVFDYVYEDGVSTTIESWVDNETGHYEVINFTTIDQTTDWDDDQNLHFNIGTVRLGQTWETTFRLAVKTEGNINIFGPGSTISFNNGTDSLELPDTFITAVPLNNTGMDFAALVIDNLVFTGTMPIDEFLPVAWDLNYTGLYDVTEDVFYSNDNEYTWVKFDTLSATNTTTGGTSTLDVRGLLPGEYTIWVRGSAPDTADSSQKITMDVHAGATGGSYIRIQ